MPNWIDSQMFQWIANNGFAVVFAILLLGLIVVPILALLRYVIFDAVRYFTNRLDSMSLQQANAFDKLSVSIDRQSDVIALSREQAVRNNEALSTVLMFLSHTQQEVVAHRTAVEGPNDVAPSPPITSANDPHLGDEPPGSER